MSTYNFDGMLELLAVDQFDLTQLKKKYRLASLKHHPDKGGDAELFKILSHHYQLLLPLIEKNSLTDMEIESIRQALLLSSEKSKEQILNEIKKVNIEVYSILNSINKPKQQQQNEDKDEQYQWGVFNTNILNGNIFSKSNLNTLNKICKAKYATFFTPYTAKSEFFNDAYSLSCSTLRLSIYLCLSSSALDYLTISTYSFSFGLHSPIGVLPDNFDIDSVSFSLKAALYSIIVDMISTLIKPIIDTLTLSIRLGVTLAMAIMPDSSNKPSTDYSQTAPENK